MSDIIIFGAGSMGRRCLRHMDKVTYFVDNNSDLVGKRIDGVPVLSPSELPKRKIESLVVASTWWKEIINQIRSMGLLKKNVYIWLDHARSLSPCEDSIIKNPFAEQTSRSISWTADDFTEAEIEYLKKRLNFIFAIPKTASRIIHSCVDYLQKKYGPDWHLKLEPISSIRITGSDTSLQGIVRNLPFSSNVYRSHEPLSYRLLQFIETMGRSITIIFRHPADSLVAIYCNDREKTGPLTPVTNHFPNNVSLIEKEYLSDSVEAGMARLIDGLTLNELLFWYARWLSIAPYSNLTKLKYEDFFEGRQDAMQSIFEAMFPGQELADEDIDFFEKATACFKEMRVVSSERYPRGYSGGKHVWKRYFNRDHIAAYNRKVKLILEATPILQELLRLYPDLYLDEDSNEGY